MLSESGAIIYQVGPNGEEKRIRDWGSHCDWPPTWMNLPEYIKQMYTPEELEGMFQAQFQRKCYQALEFLYDISPSSLGELMDYCRKLPFWINPDGKVTFSPEKKGEKTRSLWEHE